MNLRKLGVLIRRAKEVATEYYELTGKPLGITGEVAEYEAGRLMGALLCDARQKGFDAVGTGKRKGKRVQIKGRRIVKDGGRVPSISLKHPWDLVWLVKLNELYEPLEIWEAKRRQVEIVLRKPGSKARNQRGSLGISQFEAISKKIWESS